MNIRQTVHFPRRVLSLALCAAMVLTLLPLPARAEGICAHHPEHTADCGYKAAVAGQACSHVCGEECYTVATDCKHTHGESCYSDGMLPAEGEEKTADACTHECTEESGCVTKAHTCVHTDHEGCGFVAAVAGSPCTYRCEICAQQQNGQDLCAHGNDLNACEACASAKKVAQVQAQIDALPGDVTAESKEAAQSALSAVDTAKSALTESEQAQLDMTRYTALTQKLAALESPAPSATEETTEKTAKVLTAWAWIDEEGYLDEETGGLALPGASEEMPAYFVDVVTFLPYEITATVDGVEETLTIDWVCDNYPEDGAYEGEYTFTATLPEGYALDEGVQALTVDVLLGGIKRYATEISYMTWDGSQKKLVSDTCNNATEVTGGTEDVTWPAGWYVVNQDVTFGTIIKPVTVRADGDIHLILGDGKTCTIYGRIEVNSSNGENDSLTIYGQSDQTGTLKVENVSHYGCSNSDGCDGTKGNLYFDAAIGGKCTNQDFNSLAGCDTKITINGGVVNASYSQYDHSGVRKEKRPGQGAAIGSGPSGKATITINAGDVTGTSDSGAGIGSGNSGESIVVINGGTVHGYSTNGAGIGIGSTTNYKTANITINGGTVTGTSSNGAGIGSASGQNTGGSYANIFINGGNVTGNSSLGAGIGSGTKTLTASIEISGGTVVGQGSKGAGIGSGENSGEATIVIKGGKVTAKSSTGAAIGSGNNADNNKTKISITGGDISASTERNNKAGAAIGGGNSGMNKVAEIVIRDATVYAKAGGEAPGIGDGNVTISNSTVQAYGGKYAAGIGSRQQTNSNTITIENSNVTAVGGAEGAAGIGTGNFHSFSNSAMGKITITDSIVNAKGTAGAAGIGGGARVQVDGSNIEISGGTVYACRGRLLSNENDFYQAYDIGDGEIPTDQQGVGKSYCKFTLPANGTAWVYLESDNNRKSITTTSGVILEKKQSDGGYETCTVYGAQNLSADYPIASGRSMTVTSGATLNTGNYGIYVQNGGTLKRDGTVNGNVYYPLTLTDCTATNTTPYQSSLFGKAGSTITLTPTLPSGYKLDSWTVTPSSVSVSDYSFKMPNEATTVEAKGTQVLQITQQPVDKTITYGANDTLSVTAQNSSGGTDGITYQWYKGTEKLPNETSKTLSLRYLNASTQPYSFYCEVSCNGVSINSKTATVTVNKAQASVTIDSDPSKTYDGTPVATPSHTFSGSGYPIVEYKLKDADDSTYTKTPPMDAGEYTIRVTMSETQNYKGASDTKDFTISKATDNAWQTEPSVTNFTYGDTVTNPVTYEAKYGNGNVVVTYKKQETEGDPSTTVPTDAGIYDVTVSLAETASYPGLPDENLTLTISPRSIAKPSADTTAFTYTGEPQTYTLDESEWYTITGNTRTDAGSQTVTVALKDKQNTRWKDGTTDDLTFPFSIAKADSSVTKAPEDAKSLYSGEDEPLVTEGTAQGGTMMYRLGEDGSWTELLPQAAAHGEYTVYYYVKGDGNHEDTAQQSLKARIRPFEITGQTEAGSIKYGESTELSVTLNDKATDVSGITYQWCQVTVEDGREVYTPLEGETGSSLTLTKPNAGTYVYGCIITCGDYSETSGKATVTVTPVEIPAGPGTGIDLSGFWLEGGEAPASENQTKIPEKSPSSRLLTKYTYNGTSNDAHQNYPTGMEIYSVQEDDQGKTTVAPVAELGNLLRYSGCSIRITGKPGIRMITSLTKEAKAALTKANLAGYTLEEYGTVAVWSTDLDNQPLTLNTKKSRSNYAYKRGVSDPVFANVGALTQYTNVLVWDSLEAGKYAEDIVMRPYIKLINKEGETVVLYGGTVSRSIGYVAQQNANTFAKGTAGYKYVHEIIDKVNALNSSTGTNTTTGGNG